MPRLTSKFGSACTEKTREKETKRGNEKWNPACAKSISTDNVGWSAEGSHSVSHFCHCRERVSYGLIGREIISDAILARTQPRCRVIIVKARLPSLQLSLSILLSSTCPTTILPSLPYSLAEETTELPIAYTITVEYACVDFAHSDRRCVRDVFSVIKMVARLHKGRHYFRYCFR